MAIKANEIRVGNWLGSSLLKKTTYHQVDTHFLRQLVFNSRDEDIPILPFFWEPIPLTPKILKKAGFEPMNYGDGGFFYEITHGDFTFTQGDKNGFCEVFLNDTNLRVQYVHQLQNLYFALTGEELTINL
jgi:hypothetical protein